MKQVIVQFHIADKFDLDRCYEIDEALDQAFSHTSDGVVDGHDVGEGRFNIYIDIQSSWEPVLERIDALLILKGAKSKATIVKFHPETERYEIVSPPSFDGVFTI